MIIAFIVGVIIGVLLFAIVLAAMASIAFWEKLP